MNFFTKVLTDINSAIQNVVWGTPMLVLIIATGIFFTVKTKFFQITKFKLIIKETFLSIFKKDGATKSKDKNSLSQFQALSTALASTIGTGNIAGVATAITIGGPGSVFWMWISALFGMMTSYSENVLGVFYRRKNKESEWCGGAMYYLRDGVGGILGKVLSILFAIFCVFASFGIGNMTQMNSIATALNDSFNAPALYVGIILAVVVALIVLGGAKRLGKVTEKLVPFMSIAYILGAIIIILINIKNVPGVFTSIFKNAFGYRAAFGGIAGAMIKQAITMGFKRGIFSNEAGLGSTVIVNSVSDVKEPAVQGMWGIFEVFTDTIVVCTMTALVILSSGVVKPFQPTTENLGIITVSEQERYEISKEKAINNASSHGKTLSEEDLSALEPIQLDNVNLYDYEIVPVEYDKDIFETLDNESQYLVSFSDDLKLTGVVDPDTDLIVTVDDKPNSNTYGTVLKGVPFVSAAFSHGFGKYAGYFLSIAILFFAFSTILGWSFYGTKAFEFLFGTKSVFIYKIIFVLFIVVGATMNLELAWSISDTLNGLMAIPNLIGVLVLSPTVFAITKNYLKRKINKDTSCQPMLSIFPDIQAEQEEKDF